MTTWQKVETETVDILTQGLPGFAVAHYGGHDSTKADISVKGQLGNVQISAKIEVKKTPSVGGVQLVVRREDDGVLSTRSKANTAPELLSLANNHKDVTGKFLLTGNDRNVAFSVFEKKYKGVDFIIGVSPQGYVISKTTAIDLAQNFNPYLITRPKKSGSRSLPMRLHNEVKLRLEREFSVVQIDKRTMVQNTSDYNEAQALLDSIENDRLFINSSGEIRILGTTRNLNTLLSLDVSENASYVEASELSPWLLRNFASMR